MYVKSCFDSTSSTECFDNFDVTIGNLFSPTGIRFSFNVYDFKQECVSDTCKNIPVEFYIHEYQSR